MSPDRKHLSSKRLEDPRGLVGDGYGGNLGGLALQERSHPGSRGGGIAPRPSDDRGGADHQQLSEITIAHLRYPSQTLLAAGGVLTGHQAEEGREPATGPKHARVGDTDGQGRRRENANAGDTRQALACLILSVPRQKSTVQYADLFS